jgi:hypothetical protein
MESQIRRLAKPRCVLLVALAPPELPAAVANHAFNQLLADRRLPLCLWHDHFIGEPGGVAIFHSETGEERAALLDNAKLDGWRMEWRPLIFSFSPAAFDEQIAFTLRAYRGLEWESVRRDQRPEYGDPNREAQTAQEDIAE